MLTMLPTLNEEDQNLANQPLHNHSTNPVKKLNIFLLDTNREQDMQQKVMQDHQENQELF